MPRSTRRRGRPPADAPSPAQQTQQPPAKEQFPLSLGPHRGRGVVNVSILSHTHPPLSPVSSCGRFERAINRTTHAPSAGTQVSASHTPTPLRTGNETPEPGPCIPPPCPTVGTSVGSLVPLVLFLGAWLALPNPSQSASVQRRTAGRRGRSGTRGHSGTVPCLPPSCRPDTARGGIPGPPWWTSHGPETAP